MNERKTEHRKMIRAGRGAAAGLCLLLAFGSGCAAWGQQATAKKRVAVFDFDAAAASSGVSSMFFQTTGPNLGKAVADQLVTRLVQNGNANVIERSAIDKLLAEQNLTNSDRTDALTAAKLGRILGVDVIIMGSITEYSYDDKMTGGGSSGVAGIGAHPTTTKHDIKGRVKLNARLVSPDTAEVLAVSEGAAEQERKNVKEDMRDMSRNPMTNPGGANNPMMAELLAQAVADLAKQIEQNLGKLPPRAPTIEGLVADANESGRLVLNVGSRNGLKAGDRLEIWRPGKEIRDPASGKVLMRDDTLVGECRVKDVTEISAIAVYQGTEPVKVGDIVKSPAGPAKPQ